MAGSQIFDATIYFVIGSGFGDEGKGTMTDFLVRTFGASIVVRYNGGAQAGHNVVLPDGRWHCFSQFGSGTFIDGTVTYLSSEMLIEPRSFLIEEEALRHEGVVDSFRRTIIDANATIITPFHKMLGQIKELSRGSGRYGSCGMGVGPAVFDRELGLAVTLRDVLTNRDLQLKINFLAEKKFAQAREIMERGSSAEMQEIYDYFLELYYREDLAEIYRRFISQTGISIDMDGRFLRPALDSKQSLVFEGAQGALLDRYGGFSPYVTKTRTTFHNAEKVMGAKLVDLAERRRYEIKKIGVMRAYGHRHGAGPFVTEDNRLRSVLVDPHNPANPWQQQFRVGWFDLPAIRYGLLLNEGVDFIALTNLDQLTDLEVIKVCTTYIYRGDLAVLDKYFEWEPLGKRKAKIKAFKKWMSEETIEGELAGILFQCSPGDWLEFDSWSQDLRNIKKVSDWPAAARRYIDFLESEDGLKTPISLISVSPTCEGKRWRQAT